MPVKIRLMRVGKKKQPSYRVVVADSRSPRDGRYIEIIGQYRPREEPSAFVLDNDRAMEWLRKGAQPSEQVHRLMVGSGFWEQYEADRSSPSLAARVATRKAKGAEISRAAKEAAKAEEAARAKAEAEAQAAASEESSEAAEAPEAEAAAEGGDDAGE